MKHDPYGPSSFARRYRCPGSLAAERDLPDTGSDAAAEGTLLHAHVADMLRDGTTADRALSDEQQGAVERAVEFVRETVAMRFEGVADDG